MEGFLGSNRWIKGRLFYSGPPGFFHAAWIVLIPGIRTQLVSSSVVYTWRVRRISRQGRSLEPPAGIANLRSQQQPCSAANRRHALFDALFPIATATYCTGQTTGKHVKGRDEFIKRRYASRVKALRYRYKDVASDMSLGGVFVSDGLRGRKSDLLFRFLSVSEANLQRKTGSTVI
jgi:hypothetical protein